MSLINGFSFNPDRNYRKITIKLEESETTSEESKTNDEKTSGEKESPKDSNSGKLVIKDSDIIPNNNILLNYLEQQELLWGSVGNITVKLPGKPNNSSDNSFSVIVGSGVREPINLGDRTLGTVTLPGYTQTEEYYPDGSVKSRIQKNSEGVITHKTEFDESGNITSETEYNDDGSLKKETKYTNGVISLETDYEAGEKVSETEYNEDGQPAYKTTYGEFGNATSKIKYTYCASYDGDNDGKPDLKSTEELLETETTTNDKGEKVVTVTYAANGKKSSETIYNSDGTVTNNVYSGKQLLSSTVYDSDNKQISKTEYTYRNSYSGSPQTVTVYNSENVITTELHYNLSGDVEYEAEYYENGNKKSDKKWNVLGRLESEAEYYDNGNKKSEIQYGSNGAVSYEAEYYDNGNKKSEIQYDYNGAVDAEREYHENGVLSHEKVYGYYGIDYEVEYNTKGEKVLGIQYNYGYSYEAKDYVLESTTHNIYENGIKVASQECNPDGLVQSETTYDKDGNQTSVKYFSYIENADGTKIRIAKENGVNTGAAILDAEGNVLEDDIVLKEDGTGVVYEYNEDGSIKSEKIYDSDFNHTSTTIYNEDGTRTVQSFSNDVITNEVTYDENGEVLQEVFYTKGVKTREVNYEPDSYTEILFSSDGKPTSQTKNNADGTVVETAFENGVKTSETTYQFDNVIKETFFDAAGNVTSENSYKEVDENSGNATIYDKNGNAAGTIRTYTDSKGVVITEFTSAIDNSKILRYQTGDNIYEDRYSSTGELQKSSIYNLDGTIVESYTYTYKDYIDSENYSLVREDLKGNVYTEIFENGVKVKSHYYDVNTGAVKTTYYDKDGKAKPDAREGLKGSIGTAMGDSASYKEIYDAIYTDESIDVCGMGISLSTAINAAVGGDAPITNALLGYARVGYSGTPSGCDEIYTNYLDTDYADFIKKDIEGNDEKGSTGLADDGFDPAWVKGYHFKDTSSISKAIANSSYFQDYVEKLIRGEVDITTDRLDFNYEKATPGVVNGEAAAAKANDLYYSLHGTDVVDMKLEGTKLTLTIYDLYDFSENEGGMLAATGAALQKDGKLVPYFMLIEVTIDLRDLFSDEELKNLGIL